MNRKAKQWSVEVYPAPKEKWNDECFIANVNHHDWQVNHKAWRAAMYSGRKARRGRVKTQLARYPRQLTMDSGFIGAITLTNFYPSVALINIERRTITGRPAKRGA